VKDKKARDIIEELIENGEAAIIDDQYKVNYLDIKTALNGGTIISQNITDNSKYVVLPGSLVKKTIDDIVSTTDKYKNVKFVVNDGTKIFIDVKDWLLYKRKGLNVEVLESVNVALVTLNPYSPEGYYFNQEEFLLKMKEHIRDILVVDVMYGGGLI